MELANTRLVAEVEAHRSEGGSTGTGAGDRTERRPHGDETVAEQDQGLSSQMPEPPRPPLQQEQEPDTAGPGSDGAPTTGRTGAFGRFQAQTESFRAVSQRVHLGALAGGITLVIFGLLLLGGTQFAWRGLLDAVLAGLGIILVFSSVRGGNRQGLMVAGVLLALVMLSVWRADVPLTGGVRFHTVTPVTPADLAKPIQQSAGTLTIDLRKYPPGPLPPIKASVGVGRLVVVEPPLTAVSGTAQVGGGYVSVGPADKKGVGVALPLSTPGAPTRGPADLRVGLGDLEVQSAK